MRNDILERREEIESWIAEGLPKLEICERLKCRFDTLQSYLKKMGIDYDGQRGKRKLPRSPKYIPAEEYIKKPRPNGHILKRKLLKEGIKEHRCEICGTEEWMGQPIPLELDHVDGNRFHNTMENIRLICPNCHAQTETNSGKNVGRYSNWQREQA